VQELIDYSAKSQLSVELASECLALAPWNDVPAATLRDRLRRSREAWRTLRPTREETIPIQDDNYITYEGYGNVFAKGKPSQMSPDGDDPGVTRMLELWEMPAEGEDTRGRYHKYVDIGMDVLDVTFDPSQDALFFVEKQGFVDLLSPGPLWHHYPQPTSEDRITFSTCGHYPATCTIQTLK